MRSLCSYQKCDGFHIPMRWRFNADQVLEKSLMAILEFPFIQRLTQHILPLIVLPDKIRDLKLCLKEDLKEGFGFHFTLIFIQFQSRTHPRNLLTWFQHYDKESGGKRLFNFKLAIILHPSYWNRHKQTRETSLCGHLSKFSGRGRGCVEISWADLPPCFHCICAWCLQQFVCMIFIYCILNNAPTTPLLYSFSHSFFQQNLLSTLSAPGTILDTGIM